MYRLNCVERTDAIAGKPAPTGFAACKYQVSAAGPVGAGLPAMRPAQALKITAPPAPPSDHSTDPPSPR
ncbi:hypothetical protein DLD99_19790 [Pseudomonas kribbensis]|uniref:Uncharacterized protein n=1 Tax=Pseudomonas kribbensis TaxID=1628086 RepID=A0A345RTK4_9PSED|nr:hypothetical protein DLD99_19790 [Pseudomonas kribbensis]